MMEYDKFLFLDFDNTLVHTLCPSSEGEADSTLKLYGSSTEGVKFELEDGWYVSFIRPGTREFLSRCHREYGKENVGILSTGTCIYVGTSLKNLNLDVLFHNIYGREDISQYVPRFKDKNLVLVDNEDYNYHRYHSGKVRFMFDSPWKKFVNIPSYDVRYPCTDIDVDTWMKRIEMAFNYKEQDNET